MKRPNAIWRLSAALFSIAETKKLFWKCTQTNDEKLWIRYVFEGHGAPVELALIIDDRLSTHAYLAERVHDFFYKLNDYGAFDRPLNNPHNIKQCVRIYDALYTAILKLLFIELKKLKLDKDTIKRNAYKILDTNDPYFEPVIKYFQEKILETIYT